MRVITAGATSQTVYVEVLDSTSTTGGRKTGLAYNTASLVAYYARNGAAAVAITLVTQTAAGAYSSGGFVEVDATNMPGIYRLDVPNAALAAGAASVVITLKGATGMVQVSIDVQLTVMDFQVATIVASSVTGAVGSVTGAVGSVTGAVGSVTGNVGGNVVGSVASVTGAVGSVTAAVVLSAKDSMNVRNGTAQAGAASTITLDAGASATDNLYNGMTVRLDSGTGAGQARVITGYVGSTKVATVDRAWATNPDSTSVFTVLGTDAPKTNTSLEAVAASVTGAVGSVTGNVGGNVVGSTASVTGAVGSVTGNVGGNVVGSVGSVTGAVGSVTGAVGSVTGNVGGNVVGSVASVTGAVGSVTGAVGSVTGAVGSVTAAVTLNAKDSMNVRNGTAQAGAASTITLDASASATDSLYNGMTVRIDSGTAAGQARVITGYVGATKVATVDRAWSTNPDNTSVFTILGTDAPKTNSSL